MQFGIGVKTRRAARRLQQGFARGSINHRASTLMLGIKQPEFGQRNAATARKFARHDAQQSVDGLVGRGNGEPLRNGQLLSRAHLFM